MGTKSGPNPYGPRLVKVNLLWNGWCARLHPDVKVVALNQVLRFLGGHRYGKAPIVDHVWTVKWWNSKAMVVYWMVTMIIIRSPDHQIIRSSSHTKSWVWRATGMELRWSSPLYSCFTTHINDPCFIVNPYILYIYICIMYYKYYIYIIIIIYIHNIHTAYFIWSLLNRFLEHIGIARTAAAKLIAELLDSSWCCHTVQPPDSWGIGKHRVG